MTLRFAPLPLLITGTEARLLLKGQDAANQVPGVDLKLGKSSSVVRWSLKNSLNLTAPDHERHLATPLRFAETFEFRAPCLCKQLSDHQEALVSSLHGGALEASRQRGCCCVSAAPPPGASAAAASLARAASDRRRAWGGCSRRRGASARARSCGRRVRWGLGGGWRPATAATTAAAPGRPTSPGTAAGG